MDQYELLQICKIARIADNSNIQICQSKIKNITFSLRKTSNLELKITMLRYVPFYILKSKF